MEEGAFGLSAGLIYVPAIFAKTEELVELCRVVSRFNGVFSIHVRGEGKNGLEAIKEAIRIAKEADVPLEISHLKAFGRGSWGESVKRLRVIEEAREEGVDVTADYLPLYFRHDFHSRPISALASQRGR